jgi:hypothetical protein
MPCPSHTPWFHWPHNICRRVHSYEAPHSRLLLPVTYHLIPLRCTHSPGYHYRPPCFFTLHITPRTVQISSDLLPYTISTSEVCTGAMFVWLRVKAKLRVRTPVRVRFFSSAHQRDACNVRFLRRTDYDKQYFRQLHGLNELLQVPTAQICIPAE